jgi:hypothetical protein
MQPIQRLRHLGGLPPRKSSVDGKVNGKAAHKPTSQQAMTMPTCSDSCVCVAPSSTSKLPCCWAWQLGNRLDHVRYIYFPPEDHHDVGSRRIQSTKCTDAMEYPLDIVSLLDLISILSLRLILSVGIMYTVRLDQKRINWLPCRRYRDSQRERKFLNAARDPKLT